MEELKEKLIEYYLLTKDNDTYDVEKIAGKLLYENKDLNDMTFALEDDWANYTTKMEIAHLLYVARHGVIVLGKKS